MCERIFWYSFWTSFGLMLDICDQMARYPRYDSETKGGIPLLRFTIAFYRALAKRLHSFYISAVFEVICCQFVVVLIRRFLSNLSFAKQN